MAFKTIEMNKDFQVKGYENTLLSDSVFVNFFRCKTLDLRSVEVHRGGRDLPMNVSYCLDQMQLKNCNFLCVQRLRVQTYSLIINNTYGYLEKFLNLAVIESLEITNNDDQIDQLVVNQGKALRSLRRLKITLTGDQVPTLDNLPVECKLEMLKIRCQLSLSRIYEVSVKNFSDYFLQKNYTMLSKETVYELNTW